MLSCRPPPSTFQDAQKRSRQSYLATVGMVCHDQKHKCRGLKPTEMVTAQTPPGSKKMVFSCAIKHSAWGSLFTFASYAWDTIIWEQRPVSCKKFFYTSFILEYLSWVEQRDHDSLQTVASWKLYVPKQECPSCTLYITQTHYHRFVLQIKPQFSWRIS